MTPDELMEITEELADMAMNIEDDEPAERLIHIAAQLRTVAREGLSPSGQD